MIGTVGALHRFGLGPRPGDHQAFSDVRAAIHDEIATTDIALLAAPDLVPAGEALAQLVEERQAQQEAERARQDQAAQAQMAPADGGERVAMAPAEPPPMRQPQAPAQQRHYLGEITARLARYRQAGIGYVERLVVFWANHFAIEASAGPFERTLVGAFEREAIRPFVLGRFRDMLGAATKHQAMLSYLDNAQSVGPNSPAGRRRDAGLNENHARELLELHTLGVDAGYTQADVTEMARILTGWSSAGRNDPRIAIGSFVFRAAAHEPGAHTVLGVRYPEGGIDQGEAVLDRLADHPATATHIAYKLARHFIADEPPQTLVDTLAAVFAATEGDLNAVAAAMIDADEAFADPTKIKPPQLFVWSAMRALSIELPTRQVVQGLRVLGQPIWDPPSPEGFSDESATWLAPDAITNRLDIAELMAERARLRQTPAELVATLLGDAASADTRHAVAQAETPSQALALLLMSPEFQRI